MRAANRGAPGDPLVPDRHQLEITLSAMRFHVRVGVLPHEREHPQPLEVDLTVRRDAGGTVLDYRDLYTLVEHILGGDALEYLEQIASTIASRAVALDTVTWARVTVRKSHVMLAGPLGYAEVSLERRRD